MTLAPAPLPLLAHDILRGLYTHRLMSTSQVADLYAPDRSLRWTQMVLQRLEDQGLVARVRVADVRSREFAWYLTRAGVNVTEGPGVEVRPYRLTSPLASGPLQAHTLDTNEVGLAFVRAARHFADDCWSEAWRNETAHPLGPAGRGGVIIADAVLDYTVYEAGASTYLCRFIEIDRATTSARTLVRKLEGYARLHAYLPGWRSYPIFPWVTVVMSGPPEPVLQRRIDALDRLIGLSAPIANAGPDLVVLATTLHQLRTHGPHAPIFWRAGGAHLVDIRGRETAR